MKKDYFDTNVIKKPWGVEYVVYRNKKNLSVTYLRIKPNQQTSLHCHFKKKNWFYNSFWYRQNTIGSL